MSPQVEIAIAGSDAQTVIEHLVQLYIHDMSELFAGTPRCEIGDNGRFRSDIDVGKWWQAAGHIPLLVRVNGRLCGFALINNVAHSGTPVDCNMAEFFVVRKHRRCGVGMAAAHAIFGRYPGRWEAAVMRANHAARGFWAHCIASHPTASAITSNDCNDQRWNGTLFGFSIAPG